MAKAGDDYQDVVGAVARALDPCASVKVGQWIEGPDGRRDLDVEVRGTIDGASCFVLIECKDWADPVGIAVVDALDSKRKDLNADRGVIYSNSGFTAPALRKARRVGIETASALKAGDKRIKIVLERLLIAKRLSVDSLRATLYPRPDQDPEVEHGWRVDQLLCDGLPVKNWISELSLQLIQGHEGARQITFRCVFKPHPGWSLNGRAISVAGLEMVFKCSKKWMAQTVRVHVTLGLYDYLRQKVVVPAKQGYMMGWIDQEAWKEVDSGWEEKELEPNSFELFLTMLHPIPPVGDGETPAIADLISEQEVRVE
ncbi:MAG: restriction endonuclease [Planctomycetota bacterium]|nr:restriction endonuclease [Planctomycetota bacterium]